MHTIQDYFIFIYFSTFLQISRANFGKWALILPNLYLHLRLPPGRLECPQMPVCATVHVECGVLPTTPAGLPPPRGGFDFVVAQTQPRDHCINI